MSKLVFPPVEEADEDGFLGISREVSVPDLLDAYSRGIFPWPWSEEHIAWFSPSTRAVLFLEQVSKNRSLKRSMSSKTFTFERNKNFRAVIEACRKAKNRKGQRGTWITDSMVKVYTKLSEDGYAESFETYEDGILVGGVYGVRFKNYFSAESMFYEKSNASKFAIMKCIEVLSEEGLTWIDCQVINPFTQKLGAIEISRAEFIKLLTETLAKRD